jgi:signal transduction histidine kinase
LNKEQLSYNSAILQSSENLLTIINEILDFSKVEAGKLTLEEVGFELPVVIDNVLKTMAFKAEEKNLDLSYFVDKKIPKILLGDPVRVSQILVNILGSYAF